MAKLLGIHGIGQQGKTASQLVSEWYPACCAGLQAAEGSPVKSDDFTCTFYADLFQGLTATLGDDDVNEEWFEDFVEVLAQEQIRLEKEQDDTATLGYGMALGMRLGLDRALRILMGLPIFGGLSAHAVRLSLSQVRKFLFNQAVREQILERVAASVLPDTQIILAHSLGSVVAYEALRLHPEWQVHTLITLGSPLGISKVIFDHLTPPRDSGGRAPWPGNIRRWINLADRGDIVSLRRDLCPLFRDGNAIQDVLVDNGWREAHDATRYLAAPQTGRALIEALTTNQLQLPL